MLEKKILFKNSFIYKDAKEFSKTSGDFNCIHLDQEFASKSIHGKRVVHGMNVVFWALECFFMRIDNNKLVSIDIKFKNPIFFKQLIYLEVEKKKNNIYRFIIFDENSIKASIAIVTKKNNSVIRRIHSKLFRKVQPEEVNLENLKQSSNEIDIRFNSNLFKKKFKNLYKKIDHYTLGSLLATSRIVGMRTPGMFSRYISLKTKFNKKSNKLSYSIQNYDDRFNLLYLNLEGSLNGTIEAIIPQKPIKIMTAYEINKLIKKHKFNLYSYFEGKKVLVVGGSRGLGAYLVKAFSLLGAEVLFSYNKNKNDSLDIIRDLKSIKKKNIRFCKINILQNNISPIEKFKADYVFYMATPQIGKIYDKNKIDQNKLNLFYDFYIKGFLNIYNFYARNYKNKIMFFYPSSIHVNKSQKINSEYVIIKRLGEEICSSLNHKLPNHKILILKIKPLLTDQHLSFYKSQNLENPIKYIFSIIQKIKSMKK